ncbi:GTP-binding protein [Flavobacterium sedimenticola]|uniref:GTP-binding protein n=1 Tax=Flavobacterium sedimenticola TaxID=3043286 RepID=A0ABT6XR87_9FLAO|nr:GTP-binding protein [Flavobacterium sedimenticola]MDI9257538.1 GTP-binding protein [Flavobacterium sedimenticola]
MDTQHEVRLRPRFYLDVAENIAVVREKFATYRQKNQSTDFIMKLRNNHVQFTLSGEKRHYWSPHLSIELEAKEGNEQNATHIRGLFGPDQTLWTLFMFLHFVVAGIFILFGMFAYSNYTLKESMTMDLVVMFLMVIVWFLLYVIARQIREKGHTQTDALEAILQDILRS